MDTIFVKSVKYQGPAVVAGLNIGDRIVSVNGDKVNGRSYAQVVQMIQKSRDSLFLEVVAKQDDLLQVVSKSKKPAVTDLQLFLFFQYFSDIAQNPESNQSQRSDPGGGGGGSKPPWPASVCSSSSRESSPFSSKTSDSTRDSVYGTSTPQPQIVTAPPQSTVYTGWRNQNPELRELYQKREETRVAKLTDTEHIYDTIGSLRQERRAERLSALAVPSPASLSASSELLYSAVPALASSSRSGSSSTLLSARDRSRDSLDSDNSGGFRAGDRHGERKEDFLKRQTYPAYLSSPPKDIDQNPRGIANLASTMPPKDPDPEPEPPKNPAKNFFMDIYAQEMSKMQTTAKTSAVPKKKHFDASQFNAYGLPLGKYKLNIHLQVRT